MKKDLLLFLISINWRKGKNRRQDWLRHTRDASEDISKDGDSELRLMWRRLTCPRAPAARDNKACPFLFFLRLGNEHAQQARVNCLERTRVPVCASSGYPITAQSTCSPHRAALCVPEPACRNQRMLEGRGKEEQDEKAARRKLHCQHRLFIRKNLFHSSGETLDGTAKGRSSKQQKAGSFWKRRRGAEKTWRRPTTPPASICYY